MGRQNISKGLLGISQIKPYTITTLFSQNADQLNDTAQNVIVGINKPFYLNKIQRMKLTSALAQSALLSLSQVSQSMKMFVINKKITETKKWTDKTLNQPEDFQYFINAKIKKGHQPILCKQQSVSFPFLHADIHRYNHIQVQYNNIDGQIVNRSLTGYQAFAFQQAWDYSFGRNIIDWRLHQGNLTVQEDIKKNLLKTTSVIEQYSNQLKKMFIKFPNLIVIPEKIDERNIQWLQNRGYKQKISIQTDYALRIYKHYKRQMSIFLQRLEHNII